jgi:uncharacterized membrane protein YgaE (UPF0421/DUF939 family)
MRVRLTVGRPLGVRLADARGRLYRGLVPGIQAAVAAGAAWSIGRALGHEQPLFAPIAAVVALGATASGRYARAVELTLGVAIGILAGDLLRATLGHNGWSIGLAVFVAIGCARLLDERPLMLTQAGISAILAVTLDPRGGGLILTRLADAGVGVATAVLVAAVVFPPRPGRLVEEALRRLRDELGGVLHESALALERVDTPRAERALDRARGLDEEVAALDEATAVARDTLLTRPHRTLDRRRVAEIRDALPHLDLAARNIRVLARAVFRHARNGAEPPASLLASFRELENAVGAVLRDRHQLESHALDAVALASRASAGRHDLPVHAVVAQIRSIAVDLQRAGGLEREQALDRVAAAATEPISPASETSRA